MTGFMTITDAIEWLLSKDWLGPVSVLIVYGNHYQPTILYHYDYIPGVNN